MNTAGDLSIKSVDDTWADINILAVKKPECFSRGLGSIPSIHTVAHSHL